MSDDAYDLSKAYEPKRYEVIGVTLIGSKLPDGTIKLDSGATFPEWPRLVRHMGTIVGLSEIHDAGPIRTGGRVEHAVYADGLDEDGGPTCTVQEPAAVG